MKDRKQHLINVCYDFEKSATKQREIKGLLEAMNFLNIPAGYIITSEHEEDIQVDNKTIHILPLWKWLLT